jgi:hypothetical protein
MTFQDCERMLGKYCLSLTVVPVPVQDDVEDGSNKQAAKN